MLSKDETMNKGPTKGLSALSSKVFTGLCLGIFLLQSSLAVADTEITAAEYEAGADGGVSIILETTGDVPSVSVFETESPARIVLDLAATTSSVGTEAVSVGRGAVQAFTTLSTGGRTRVMIDLSRPAADHWPQFL